MKYVIGFVGVVTAMLLAVVGYAKAAGISMLTVGVVLGCGLVVLLVLRWIADADAR